MTIQSGLIKQTYFRYNRFLRLINALIFLLTIMDNGYCYFYSVSLQQGSIYHTFLYTVMRKYHTFHLYQLILVVYKTNQY